MWNKGLDKTEANAIFKVNSNGVYVKGNGEFTGTITASGGSIGNWTLGTPANYAAFTGALYSSNDITIKTGEN
jgi:hypothetical protein